MAMETYWLLLNSFPSPRPVSYTHLVKGLRAMSDFEAEFQMATLNRKLNPDLDTVFLTACQDYTYLSSSIVKEMARYGSDLSAVSYTHLDVYKRQVHHEPCPSYF